jgi:hypothetical protein
VTQALDPRAVAARLQRLRESYVPMDADEAWRRLETMPPRDEPFALAVHRRLRELRALCELTRALHRARDPAGS